MVLSVVTWGMRRQEASREALIDRLLTVPVMVLLAALVFAVTFAVAWSRPASRLRPLPVPVPTVRVPDSPLPRPAPVPSPLLPSGTFTDLPPAAAEPGTRWGEHVGWPVRHSWLRSVGGGSR
jgi:hypothetical protein